MLPSCVKVVESNLISNYTFIVDLRRDQQHILLHFINNLSHTQSFKSGTHIKIQLFCELIRKFDFPIIIISAQFHWRIAKLSEVSSTEQHHNYTLVIQSQQALQARCFTRSNLLTKDSFTNGLLHCCLQAQNTCFYLSASIMSLGISDMVNKFHNLQQFQSCRFTIDL